MNWPVCREVCSAAWTIRPSTVAGESGAADRADLAVGRGGRLLELDQGPLDRGLHRGDQLPGVGARLALPTEDGELRRRQLLPSGVCQETLQAAGEMAQVEARGGRAARAVPELPDLGAGGGDGDVLARLDQRMRGGHQDGADAGQRTSKPDLRTGGSAHARNLTPPLRGPAPCRDHGLCLSCAIHGKRRLTLDSGWREVADTALAFVKRFV